MRGKDLLDKLTLIDFSYIEAADIMPKSPKKLWFKYTVAAACLCLAFAGILIATGTFPLFPATHSEKDTSATSSSNTTPGIVSNDIYIPALFFNDARSMTDAARMYIPGYFKEELGGEKLSALLPEKLSRDTVISAAAGFDGEGKLLEVFLEAKAPICDNTVYVTFSKGNLADCYIFPDNPVASLLNGIYFTVFQKAADENNYMLDAYAEINGWTMRVSYTATSEALEKAKEEFSQIIFLFSSYKDGNPDFSAISPDSIPEYYDRKLSLSEAYADPDFGSYMIRDIPDGFSEESIRRYKAQSNNCLSGLWSKGLAYLSINISAFNEDASARLTDIGQTENYDLSLYPIPRADSVPESLREIVDNPIFNASELTLEAVYKRTYKVNDAGDADGPRMAFSVKYDNVIVEIRAKGITPEWIYHTLKQLLNK